MQGFKDLLQSERGVFSLATLAVIAALAVLGRITGDQALDFLKWLSGALIASKTITTAVDSRRTPMAPTVPTATTVTDELKT